MAGVSFTKLTCVSDKNFSYEIHTILWSNVIDFTFECQAWITIADIEQIYTPEIFSKILDLKFYKNLGFSISEQCEWGTCLWPPVVSTSYQFLWLPLIHPPQKWIGLDLIRQELSLRPGGYFGYISKSSIDV
jgi:hypothetical protein